MKNTVTIENATNAHKGNYIATVDCSSEPVGVYLYVKSIDNCADGFEYSAYSNSPSGEVSTGEHLQFVGNGADSYKWWGPNGSGFYAEARDPYIDPVEIWHSGKYTVEFKKVINGQECITYDLVDVNISKCRLSAEPYFYEQGGDFVITAAGNIDWNAVDIKWFRNGNEISTNRWLVLTKNNANRGDYTMNIKLKNGTCEIDKTINVDYVATPVYGGDIYAVSCDRIYGVVLDEANAYKRLNFNVTIKVDNDFYTKSVTQSGNGSGATVYLDSSILSRYNNGLEHSVTFYDPYGQEVAHNSQSSFRCCSVEFQDDPTVLCDPAGNGGTIIAALANTSQESFQFKIEKQSYNEDGNPVYDEGSWISSSTNEKEFAVTENAIYKIIAKEVQVGGGDGCTINTVVPVICSDITQDCEPPVITVFPGTTVREGEGVIPTLHVNTPAIGQSDNVEGLIMKGNSSLALPNYGYLQSNFTVEALVNPSPGKGITVGDASQGSKQRYLFKGWNGGDDTKVGIGLSVGTNGVNLIESGASGRRLVFSHPVRIKGWHHIGLVYEDDKASLYINGLLVKSSNVKPALNRKVVGPNSLGTDRRRGFYGAVSAIRIWSDALSGAQVSQLKNNYEPSIAEAAGNVGFWKFDETTEEGSFKDLSTHEREAEKQGVIYVLEPSEPIESAIAPQVSWWHNGVQVGTGSSYKLPSYKVRAGDLEYIAKYQNIDGTYCEAYVDIEVQPFNFGALSGCYLVKSNTDNQPISPKNIVGTNDYQIDIGGSDQNSERQIWKFEHLGNEQYRINSTFFTGKALENNGYYLKAEDKRVSSDAQKWNANVVNASNLVFTFESASELGHVITRSNNDSDFLSIQDETSAYTPWTEFKLVSTACPLPPSECDVNGQITFERFLQSSVIDYSYFNFQDLDVPVFVEQNEGQNPTYIHTGDIGGFKIDRPTFNAMTTPKPDLSAIGWTSYEDNWVGRMSGYFCAPENGDYYFYLKSDEWSEVWISTDEDPLNKVKVASCHSYAATWTDREWEQRSTAITMTKGRSYYVEVIFKDLNNSFYVDLAYREPGESFSDPLSTMSLEHFSSVPRDVQPGFLTVTPNKTIVAPTESVTLTADGCYYGRVVWRAGITPIQDPSATIPSITRVGPGTYQALCVGDPTVIPDWVTVVIEPTYDIVPIPSGPNYACETETITLTATAAPTGYTYKWFVLKDENAKQEFRENIATFDLFTTAPELFNITETASVNVIGPGTYYVRLENANGYESPVREITVAPAFPEELRASNNGPGEIGSVVALSTSALNSVATYSWTGPSGYSTTGRVQALNPFAESMAGTYTVTFTATGGCTATATTEVTIANCDIYIGAVDDAGEQTYKLERKNDGSGFETLTLTILPFNGTNDFTAYNITWMYNGNPMEVQPNKPTITVDQAGEYTAILALKMNPSNICETSVHLSGTPCNEYTEELACTIPSNIELPDVLAQGVSIAAGDEFSAADYTVVVTEITSGSATGWYGKGFVEMKLINRIVAKRISVYFENAVVNDCYELAGAL